MRLALLTLAALLLAPAACRSTSSHEPAPASAALPEAVAPASLVAELSLGNPKETWRRLRLLGGERAQALPSSLPVLLATSLSLPPSAAGSLDESLPMVGVVLARSGRPQPDVVLGMHVVSGQELVASLTLGDAAKFRRVDLAPRVVRLVSAPGAAEFDGALGVSGNYLLLATHVDALTEAARFLAEKVSGRARTAPGLTLSAEQGALGGALVGRLRAAWQAERARLSADERAAREAKQRPADFADPAALLAGADNTVESWLSVLESSRELSLELSPELDRLKVEAQLTPGANGAASLLLRELVVGASAPLLELPGSARAGLLVRGEAEPAEDSLSAALGKLFGDRLTAPQTERLSRALAAFSKSRRGTTVYGAVPGPVPALVIRCELADAAGFSKSFGEVLSLVDLPAVSNWLAATLGKPTLERRQALAGVERATVRFARRSAPGGSGLPKSLTFSWQARGDVGVIVVSPDAALDPSVLERAGSLEASPWLTQSAQDAAQAALALYVDMRLLLPGGPDDAPLWLSFGKKADKIGSSLEVSAPALSALAGRFALDRSP